MTKQFFVVERNTNCICGHVVRNVPPQNNDSVFFVEASRVPLTFYLRLVEVQDTVYLDEVMTV